MLKKITGLMLLFTFFLLLGGCNNNIEGKQNNKIAVTNNPNNKIKNEQDINKKHKIDKVFVDPNVINSINSMLVNFPYNTYKKIQDCDLFIKNGYDNFGINKFKKNLCILNIKTKEYFKNMDQNNRYKNIIKNNKDKINEQLINVISNFYKKLNNNKVFYKSIYKNNIGLIQNDIYDHVLKLLNSNNRGLYLLTNDVNSICNILSKNKKSIKKDKCLISFSKYQHLDVCKFIGNEKIKQNCYNKKISQCKNFMDEQGKILCVYNTLLYTEKDKDMLNSITDNTFKSFVRQVINNKFIIKSNNLKKIEQKDINIFKQLSWDVNNKDMCNELYYSNNKYQCNIFYKVLSENNIKPLKQQKKIKNDNNMINNLGNKNIKIPELINNICELENIDQIKNSKEFKILETIFKNNEKQISNELFSKCVKNVGYIGTEEIFMNLVWQDNLSIENKIKHVIYYLNNNKNYINELNTKDVNTLDYKKSIISLMLHKYKYWKYNGKTFFLNRLIDNLLYKKIISDIKNKITDEELLKLINNQYKIDLKRLNKEQLIDIILDNINKNTNIIIKKYKNYILDNKVYNKTLTLSETKEVFNEKILGLEETKKIITNEYLLMYLYPDKLFNDTVRRQNYMTKKGINGYLIENLFRFYRLKGNK